MTALRDLIEARLTRMDSRHEYLMGKVHGADLRSDLRGIWSPTQAAAQLARRLTLQRRKRNQLAQSLANLHKEQA